MHVSPVASQGFFRTMAFLYVYMINMITVTCVGLVLNIVFLVFYCQVRRGHER